MAQNLYMASFERARGPDWVARHGLSGNQYQTAFDQLTRDGFRPTCVSGAGAGNGDIYAAIFEKSAGPAWAARHGLDAAGYQAVFDELSPKGYRPKWLSAYSVGGRERFAGVWEKSDGPAWAARHGLDGSQYQAAFNELGAQGFRLRGICPYVSGHSVRYVAWWDRSDGDAWVARHGLTEAQFRATHNSLAAQGYDLASGGSALQGTVDIYAGLWEKGAAATEAHHGMTGGAYQATFDRLTDRTFRPRFVTCSWGALPVDVNLRFRIQRQQQSQWCWSAVSVSVRRFYQPASALTQCQLVNQRRGTSACCSQGSSSACDQPDNTTDVLDGLGHLASTTGSSVSYANLRNQLAAGRPVFCRIQWSGGGRHAVIAAGVEDNDFVIVCDPGSSAAGDPSSGTTSVVDYDVLRTAYNGSGSWIATGYTEA